MSPSEYQDRKEYFKSYQKIIDEVTVDECIEVTKGLPIHCNREEMIREAIIQKLYNQKEEEDKVREVLRDVRCTLNNPLTIDALVVSKDKYSVMAILKRQINMILESWISELRESK